MHFASSVVALTALVAVADAAKKDDERRRRHRRALDSSFSGMSMLSSSMSNVSMSPVNFIEVPPVISKGMESNDGLALKVSSGAKARKFRRRAALEGTSGSLSMIFIIEGVEVPTYAVEKIPDIEGADFDLGGLTTSTATATVTKGVEKEEEEIVTTKTMDKAKTKTAKASKEPKARKLYSIGRRARIDVMSMSSPTIIMDDVPTFVGGGAKSRKLHGVEPPERRRSLQRDDILSDMSMSETSMSVADAIPTMLPTMMMDVDDADPGFNIQSIHCTWQPGFADFVERPLRACKKLDDGVHLVPYLCDGAYENVCCSVSVLTNPTMQAFGTCSKADVAVVRM